MHSLINPQQNGCANPIRNGQSPDWGSIFEANLSSAKDDRLRHFYASGVVDASTPVKDIEFVALDFETTGLDCRKNDIVSIGLVPFTLNRIRCGESHHWIVNPRKPLGEESVVIHGITHSDVEGAPDLRRILDEVLDCLAGRIVVVHYRNIERGFFDAALRARIKEGIVFPVVDTMDLEARVHRAKPPGFWARLLGKKRESIRLADSRARYNLPFYQGHNALTDALATAELLQAQIAHRYSPDTPISVIWR
ncbi:3'-5' exonuclease [Parasalinivibrio latis]|uniref:3'-5' exonuclease n=1 Tax=Parasalinivibrio latis TaxID=2952610 RepID=UPI0030E2FE49